MEKVRDVKSVELRLNSGSKKRFDKADILAVYERESLDGRKETVVQVKSGYAYAVVGSVPIIKAFIGG